MGAAARGRGIVGSRLLGVLIGLSIAAPLVGSIADYPGYAYSVLFLFLAGALALFLGQWDWRLPRPLIAMVVCGVLFTVAVAASASPEQWAYLLTLDRSTTTDPARLYYERKLFTFFASFLPGAGAGLLVALRADRQRVAKGIVFGLIGASVFAFLRIVPYADMLVGTYYDVAVPFYVGGVYRPFSLIPVVLLSIFAGLAALSLMPVHGGLAIGAYVGTCLFVVAWFNLRAETILMALACITYVVLLALWQPERRNGGQAASLMTLFVIAGGLSYGAFNDVSTAYWRDDWSASIAVRDELSQQVVEGVMGSGLKTFGGTGEVGSGEGVMRVFFGRGLAAFAAVNPVMLYPHNLLLELFYETGFLGLLPFALALAIAGWVGLRQLIRGGIAPQPLAFWAFAAILFLHTQKSGDVIWTGLIAFTMVVAVPLASMPSPPSRPATSPVGADLSQDREGDKKAYSG